MAPKSVPVALRVPPEMKAWLEGQAQAEWCSLNAAAVRVFRAAMAATEAAQPTVGAVR